MNHTDAGEGPVERGVGRLEPERARSCEQGCNGNTWTDKRENYHEGSGCWPGDWFVPCGRLPAVEDSKTPNVGNEGPGTAQP